MFETAVQEPRSGVPWGLIAGLFAFGVLTLGGYLLVS